jgi:hypothetical protein
MWPESNTKAKKIFICFGSFAVNGSLNGPVSLQNAELSKVLCDD